MKNKLMTVIAIALVSGMMTQAHAMDDESWSEGQKAEWQAKHKEMWQQMSKMHTDCAEDVQKFCPNEKGHERMQCLMKNKPQLSTTCQSDVDKMKDLHKRHAEMKEMNEKAPATSTY